MHLKALAAGSRVDVFSPGKGEKEDRGHSIEMAHFSLPLSLVLLCHETKREMPHFKPGSHFHFTSPSFDL